MHELNVLSAGAAKGLVGHIGEHFAASTGFQVKGQFGAVGLMREQWQAGAPCDVLILTQAQIREMLAAGEVIAGSERALGVVKTGVALRDGEPLPDLATPDALRDALLRAKGIYFPDPQKATAGIHFMKVLQTLDIAPAVAGRLHPFPNGATAMKALADADEPGLIGCTQVTEILYTPGVCLAALLPQVFELATVYVAAVPVHAVQPAAAQLFIDWLVGERFADLRQSSGFGGVSVTHAV